MDVVGSEIGQKMRSAIKAKLTELGCYVDDELPDYVMVMVANKRTRAQMEDDLQLFLGDNTELFVNWLHQVLKKLQEVTITAPIKPPDAEKSKETSKSKEKKTKEKKAKKSDSLKKAKKKEKEKSQRKKDKVEKKLHKSKKKNKQDKHEMIRPNIPPLLMNIEKESEPSITDVFAGQILKNHGILIESPKKDTVETKPTTTEAKRPILPIIDPATILTDTQMTEPNPSVTESADPTNVGAREEHIKEINEIEAKIQGLKQKLAEQLDSMSEDEDFLNIRTEAEELMNDFAEDVFQEISQPTPITPPIQKPLPKSSTTTTVEPPTAPPKQPEELPQIELRLPKRPIRERLGAKPDQKQADMKEKDAIQKNRDKSSSPERFTPDREPEIRLVSKSAKSRLGDLGEPKKRLSQGEDEPSSKKLTSRVSVLESRPARSSCASVVRVRPRPRVTPSSSLLLKAMADAHKSLFNIPPKPDTETSKVKRAMVLPMRRCVDATNIVIQVNSEQSHDPDSISLGDEQEEAFSKSTSEDLDKDEYIPTSITKVITNTEYVPSLRKEDRNTQRDREVDDTIVVETLNIHTPATNKDKDTQFIVTMDGFNPNAFLAKKLMTEGLLEDDEILKPPNTKTDSVLKIKEPSNDKTKEKDDKIELISTPDVVIKTVETTPIQKKRLSDTSEESDTQVTINNPDIKIAPKNDENKKRTIALSKDEKSHLEKRKSTDTDKSESSPIKKRKASPIVFDVKQKEEKEKERVRERTESVSSDNVTISTTVSSSKYDSLPPLDKTAVPPTSAVPWCRSFPSCRFGAMCAFLHPRCKFAASCTRRGCVYSHPPSVKLAPVVASHVVPAANFKSITPTALPSICKFFPNCVNPTCHFYHPKPCRYGKACLNKIECNFYHSDTPSNVRYPV